jgi:hypothetical protein
LSTQLVIIGSSRNRAIMWRTRRELLDVAMVIFRQEQIWTG